MFSSLSFCTNYILFCHVTYYIRNIYGISRLLKKNIFLIIWDFLLQVGKQLSDLSYRNKTCCNFDNEARSKRGLPCSALFLQFHCKVPSFTVFKKKIKVALDQTLDIIVQEKKNPPHQETMWFNAILTECPGLGLDSLCTITISRFFFYFFLNLKNWTNCKEINSMDRASLWTKLMTCKSYTAGE